MSDETRQSYQALQQSMLEAINVLSKANDNKNVQTITVEAIVESVVDVVKGIYTVNHMNNTFQAFTNGNTYKVGQQVYVLIPNGDFSKKKIIISAVDNDTASQIQEDASHYIFTSNNIIQDGSSPQSLCSYQNENKTWNALTNQNQALFYKYAQKQKIFQLSCDIKTTLSPEQMGKRGYYYLMFTYTIVAGGESIPQTVMFNVQNIVGNPYQLKDWSRQKLIFTIADDAEIDSTFMPTLTIGCTNFIEDKTRHDDDIFFQNFSIQSLEDASKVSGYYLYLNTDNGIYLNSPQVKATKITPDLRYNGEVIDLKDAECYWFEQDASVTADHERFFSYGGPGWRCLNQRKEETAEDGTTYIRFMSDSTKYRNVSSGDVILNKFYKCVVVVDGVSYEAEIEISQLNSNFAFSVVSNNKVYEKSMGTVIITATTNLKAQIGETLSFQWVRQDRNKKYIDKDFYEVVSSKENSQEEIKFPTKKVVETNYIVCTLQSSTRGNLASKTIPITVTKELGYRIIIENGDLSFKYDANGKSPFLGAGYVNGSANAQKITPLSFKVYKDDGKELTADEYLDCDIKWMIPKDKTMLKTKGEQIDETESYHIFTGMTLDYDIESYFNNAYTNNKILLTVVFGDKNLKAYAQPHFLMDGALGTNGTKINTVIRYKSYAYNEIDGDGKYHRCKIIGSRGNETLYDETGEPVDGMSFVLDVYIEGKKVTENGSWIDGTPPKEVGQTCKWSVLATHNGLHNKDYANGSITEDSLSAVYVPVDYNCAIIKAEIPYAGKIVTTYYPIEGIRNDTEMTLEDIIQFDILDGFDYILYDNTGNNPLYNKSPFILTGPESYKNQKYNVECHSTHFYASDKDEVVEIEMNKEFTLKVADYFYSNDISHDAEIEDSELYIYFDDYGFLYMKPIFAMCNAYALASMNDWDGLKVQINDNESIYSPIVGAGKKESNNTFSGFLMGDIQENKEHGVVEASPRFTAYHKGVRTFNIDAKTGKVTIGAGNGQIIIDPNAGIGQEAIIKSADYKTGPNGLGMEINFSKPHIKFGSGKFEVNENGEITSTAGRIANFTIVDKCLYTGSGPGSTESGAIALSTENFSRTIHNTARSGLRFAIGSKFAVDQNGTVYAGNLVATGGTFSGTIQSSTIIGATIKNSSGTFSVSPNGTITGSAITGSTFSGKNGKFTVKDDGSVTCSALTIEGESSINIGGFTLNAQGLKPNTTASKFGPFSCDNNSIFVGSWKTSEKKTPAVFVCSGSKWPHNLGGATDHTGWCFGAGENFGVDINGDVYCKSIKITGAGGDDYSSSRIGNMFVYDSKLRIPLGYIQGGGGGSYTLQMGTHTVDRVKYLISISRAVASQGYLNEVIWGIKESDGSTINFPT